MADQSNPNALGAPAEGFGQTVSFAFDPRGQMPALNLSNSTPSGMGVSGAGRAQLNDPNAAFQPVKEDPTGALLMKVGADILAPHLERERTEKYVAGMQRAMNGEAVKDIVEQQPWYSRIFGDTPMVDGARAYTASTTVNKAVADQTANVDQLKAMGPEEAAKHFSKVITDSLSGDASTDALIMKGMVDTLPALMKTQAKVHYAYGQKRAMAALSDNMRSAGDSLQALGTKLAEGVITPEDFQKAQSRYVESIIPPMGINEDNYGKVLAQNIKAAAIAGNFHAVNAVHTTGGFSAMPVDEQNAVAAAVVKAATQHRDRYAFQYAGQMAELKSDAEHVPVGMTVTDIAARFKRMNDTYQKQSGSPVALFTSDEVANRLAGSFNFIKAEETQNLKHAATLANKEATATQKAMAASALTDARDKAIANGDIARALLVPGVSKDQVDLEFKRQFDAANAAGHGGGRVVMQSNYAKSGYVNDIISNDLTTPMRLSEGRDAPTSGFLAAVAMYQNVQKDNPALAIAYFKDYAPKIERYIRMTNGDVTGGNMAEAFTAAMSTDKSNRPSPLPTKEVAGLVSSVADTEGWSMPRWLGGKVTLRPESVLRLSGHAQESTEDWRGVPGISDKDAVKMGVASAIHSGQVELLGGFTISNGLAKGAKPPVSLRELASGSSGGPTTYIPAGQEDKYFEGFLKDQLKWPEGSTDIRRAGTNSTGQSQFMATIRQSDGTVSLHQFNAAEWQQYTAARTLKETAKSEKPDLAFGPDITFPARTPANDIVSIYASPAERAAKQAEIAKRHQLKQ